MKTAFLLGAALTASALSLTAADTSAAAALRATGGSEFDQAFLNRIVEHQRQGMRLAEIGVRNSVREGLKDFALKDAAAQQKNLLEIEPLQANRPVVVVPPPAEPMSPMASDLDRGVGTTKPITPGVGPLLPVVTGPAPAAGRKTTESNQPQTPQEREALNRLTSTTGDAFDSAFVQQMLAHHGEGLEMAQLARERGTTPAVKELADRIARFESVEVQELQRLRSGLGGR
jgi:uncharacterized protein (DUF305 family)